MEIIWWFLGFNFTLILQVFTATTTTKKVCMWVIRLYCMDRIGRSIMATFGNRFSQHLAAFLVSETVITGIVNLAILIFGIQTTGQPSQ